MSINNIVVNGVLPSSDSYLDVQRFFGGKNVFVTGGTGYMGIVFIEKLLRACPELSCIYLLLRVKRNKTIEQRLKKFIDDEVFDKIRSTCPEILEKIIPIQGDSIELNLGISNDDIRTLERNVDVVYHLAATVKFNDPVKKTILTNVRATRDVLDLARNMKNLKAFIHVSTLYANTNETTIEERIYTEGGDWRTIIRMAETLNERELDYLGEKLRGHHPNVYAFTKYLGENVAYDYRNEIPLVIFRPSIVSCSIKDPIPGYSSLMGSPALWFTIIFGALHVMRATGSVEIDYIPCDFCANAFIISACHRASCKTKDCIVINAASGEKRKTTIRKIFDSAYDAMETIPFEKMAWEPFLFTVSNGCLYTIFCLFFHIIPGVMIDVIFKLAGINFSMLGVYRKSYIINDALSFFCLKDWYINTENFYSLTSYLHPDEREKFEVDFSKISDLEFMKLGITGIKKYYLKEEFTEEGFARARKTRKRFKIAHFILKTFWCFIIFGFLSYFIFSKAFK